jgi:P27 family predicted phage terminase small subunit
MTTIPTYSPDLPEDVRQQFDRLVSLMDGRATPADAITLTMLATSLTTWQKATAEVARLGNVVMSGGTAIANPSLGIAAQAHRQIVELCRELGLTAASRRKLAPPDYDE